MTKRYLDLMFQAIVVFRMLYALSAWKSYVSNEEFGITSCFYNGFVTCNEEFVSLFDKISNDLFSQCNI